MKFTKYEEPKRMTLEEVFGYDENEVEKKQEELLSELDVNDYVEALRQDAEMLTRVNREMDISIANLERGRIDREEAESIFAVKILVLLHMARHLHPLSEYGRAKLSEAIKCRQEFEEMVGPLVTNITANNAELFSTVLTADLVEDISVGRLHAIGALRTVGSTVYGVGAIVFRVDESVVYENGILRAVWLYVNPDFRQRGIAHHLIGELIKWMADRNIEHASAEFPAKDEFTAILGYILGSWHFEFEAGLSPEALMKVSDVFNYGKTGAYKKGATSLDTLDDKTYTQLVSNTLRRFSYRGYLLNLIFAGSYIDRKLSCFAGTVTTVYAILLAHRTPSGRCRVEYLNCVPGKERSMGVLICSFLEAAMMSSKDDDLIELPVDMEEVGLFIDKVCSRQMGMYMVEGTLAPPSSDTDLNEEDIEQLLKASAK